MTHNFPENRFNELYEQKKAGENIWSHIFPGFPVNGYSGI